MSIKSRINTTIFSCYKNIFKDYASYFHQQLFNSNNQEALNYLIKRGLSKNIIEEFKLGYVPWQNKFYEELQKMGGSRWDTSSLLKRLQNND